MPSDTKRQILDAAETLFAAKGIDAVSLRTVTSDAGANLASVHYHFGSKEALVEAVFERRIGPLNRERIRLLDECERRAGDGPLEVEDVLRALIDPALRLSQEAERGETFMRICGRFFTETSEYLEPIFDRLFREIIERFTAALHRALPALSRADLFWRIHFAVGAMVHTMCDSQRLRHISGGLCDPSNVEEVIDRMVLFTAAGLSAPAPGRSPRPSAPAGKTGEASS